MGCNKMVTNQFVAKLCLLYLISFHHQNLLFYPSLAPKKTSFNNPIFKNSEANPMTTSRPKQSRPRGKPNKLLDLGNAPHRGNH